MGNRSNEQIIKEVIADSLSLDASKIKDGADLQKDLGIDSFGVVELAYEIKNKLGIDIPLEETNNMKMVRDLISYILPRMKG